MANVVDTVAQHRDALDAEPCRKTRIDVGVVAHLLENLWVDHARAENLDPTFFLASSATLPAAKKAVDRHVYAGLDETKEVAAEADFSVAAEEALGELEKRAFEMRERQAFVHREHFGLGDHPLVARIGRFVTVGPPRTNDPDWGIVFLHEADLVRGGVGA